VIPPDNIGMRGILDIVDQIEALRTAERHSLRIVPITRSQIEFAFGLATGDRNTSIPSTRCFIERGLQIGL
jgi:hypothetical protein